MVWHVGLLVLGLSSGPAHAQSTEQSDEEKKRERVASVLQPGYFGVPSSPAFELLPDKPSEVTHLLTPRDFQSKAMAWQENGKLLVGVAVDTRPFVASAGDLTSYARSWRRRVAFRVRG